MCAIWGVGERRWETGKELEESVGDKFDRLEVRCGCACFEAGTCQFRTSTLTALEVDRTVKLVGWGRLFVTEQLWCTVVLQSRVPKSMI